MSNVNGNAKKVLPSDKAPDADVTQPSPLRMRINSVTQTLRQLLVTILQFVPLAGPPLISMIDNGKCGLDTSHTTHGERPRILTWARRLLYWPVVVEYVRAQEGTLNPPQDPTEVLRITFDISASGGPSYLPLASKLREYGVELAQRVCSFSITQATLGIFERVLRCISKSLTLALYAQAKHLRTMGHLVRRLREFGANRSQHRLQANVVSDEEIEMLLSQVAEPPVSPKPPKRKRCAELLEDCLETYNSAEDSEYQPSVIDQDPGSSEYPSDDEILDLKELEDLQSEAAQPLPDMTLVPEVVPAEEAAYHGDVSAVTDEDLNVSAADEASDFEDRVNGV